MRSLGLRLPPAQRIDAHVHAWHQLVYATEGVMTVATPTGSWVVPPQRAVWIPACFEHSIRTTRVVRMRTLYVRPDVPARLSVRFPASCCVLGVSPLVRELVLEAFRIGMLLDDVPEHMRLVGVLADRLERGHQAPLEIRFPTDERALRVAEKVRTDLAATRTTAELARGSGASARTIERAFYRETGLTFARWRQRVRALHALELLAAGEPVTQVALAVGYDSTSAFIAMFKRVFGTTPGRYFTQISSEFQPGFPATPTRSSPAASKSDRG